MWPMRPINNLEKDIDLFIKGRDFRFTYNNISISYRKSPLLNISI